MQPDYNTVLSIPEVAARVNLEGADISHAPLCQERRGMPWPISFLSVCISPEAFSML